MANASCMAGMAFANAFLGLNHSMAHKLGAFHHLPHGIANAVFLQMLCVTMQQRYRQRWEHSHSISIHMHLQDTLNRPFCRIYRQDDEEVFENFIAKLEELKEEDWD